MLRGLVLRCGTEGLVLHATRSHAKTRTRLHRQTPVKKIESTTPGRKSTPRYLRPSPVVQGKSYSHLLQSPGANCSSSRWRNLITEDYSSFYRLLVTEGRLPIPYIALFWHKFREAMHVDPYCG
jgi:hypothetical protein